MASVRFGAYMRQNDDVAYILVISLHVWQKIYLFETVAILLASREGGNANEETGLLIEFLHRGSDSDGETTTLSLRCDGTE